MDDWGGASPHPPFFFNFVKTCDTCALGNAGTGILQMQLFDKIAVGFLYHC